MSEYHRGKGGPALPYEAAGMWVWRFYTLQLKEAYEGEGRMLQTPGQQVTNTMKVLIPLTRGCWQTSVTAME